jgi:uncharacterized membrane protein YhaH (DUF805 family)
MIIVSLSCGEAPMKTLLFSFQGRVNRAKFWLVNIGLVVVEAIVFGVAGGSAMITDAPANMTMPSFGILGIVCLLVFIVLIWAGLAIAVKRWHDRNKSGWWVLIALVPVIGGLWYLIECGFLRGTAGPNDYGPDPLSAL